MIDISLEKLLESGAHFGHQTKRWNPKMTDYVYGVRDGVYIFDLIKTKAALEQALAVITKTVADKKDILILGTKKQAKDKVKEMSKEAGVYFIDQRWLGGTFTNFNQVKHSADTLNKLRKDITAGKYATYTKKERLLLDRKVEKLERMVGGINGMNKLPELMIIVDTKRERSAILEAKKVGVTTVGIVDTNADPNMVDWPIPMNDDSPQALELVLNYIKEAIEEGKKGEVKPKKVAKAEGKVSKKKAVKKEK